MSGGCIFRELGRRWFLDKYAFLPGRLAILVLLVLVIPHALNGFRVFVIDFGISERAQRILFWVLTVFGIIIISWSYYIRFYTWNSWIIQNFSPVNFIMIVYLSGQKVYNRCHMSEMGNNIKNLSVKYDSARYNFSNGGLSPCFE